MSTSQGTAFFVRLFFLAAKGAPQTQESRLYSSYPTRTSFSRLKRRPQKKMHTGPEERWKQALSDDVSDVNGWKDVVVDAANR